MDRPSPELLAALCLFLVGVGLVTVGAADVTDPSAPRTYAVDQTDSEVRRYADLSGPAQDLVDAGANRNEAVVDELPSEFRSGSWNFVRNDGELLCLLPSDDADSGDVNVTFADGDGFGFEYEELSERGQTLFTAAMENPDGYVRFVGAPPAGLGAASINGVDVEDAPEEEGRYYVFADERVYEFSVYGPGPLGGLGELIYALFAAALGFALIAGSAYGYRISAVHAPAAAAVGASVYLVQPLAEAVGLLRWSIRLDGYSPWGMPLVIALAVGGVAYVLPDVYAFARRHV